jgi:exopolysaccharide biosynthesis WecB/TagA/CpsF family protein
MISDPGSDPASMYHFQSGPQMVHRIIDIDVTAYRRDGAVNLVRQMITAGGHLKLGFCNANMVNLAAVQAPYRQTLGAFTMLSDGIGVDLAARILHGAAFPANLNGTDFVPALLAALDKSLLTQPVRIRLLGARPGIGDKAAAVLQEQCPNLDIKCLGDGYFDAAGEAALLANLVAQPADILLVAMGNPRQEVWVADRIDARHTRVAMGVGALFDFLGGEVRRAPHWIRSLRCEWIYRLAQEPARLWQRYLVGNPVFLMRVLAFKFRGMR